MVKCLGPLRQFDGPLEQTPIHLGGDHPFAEFLTLSLDF